MPQKACARYIFHVMALHFFRNSFSVTFLKTDHVLSSAFDNTSHFLTEGCDKFRDTLKFGFRTVVSEIYGIHGTRK